MKKWQKKEKKDAIVFSGKKRPRSGGAWHMPGDLKNEMFLFECKTTDKQSFSISEKIWNKIYNEALKCKKIPCLSIQIKDKIELVVLDKNDFLSFFNK